MTTIKIAPVQNGIPNIILHTIAPAKMVTEIFVITYATIEITDKYILAEDENLFSKELYTKSIPDPDLMIRTSGEYRLSNFLLWQSAYTEIYMTETYWPNFREKQLIESINDYQNRERRFGKVSDQLKTS